jgi:alpha-N-arabinofuranosidase
MASRFLPGLMILFFLLSLPLHAQAPKRLSLTVDPTHVVHRVDEKVYGHFLEHIYHSVNGGLWGELVWNRSFEWLPPGGIWRKRNGEVEQSALEENVRLTFGDSSWTDYDYTLEAQKTGGNEGFLILFRVKSEKEFYWLNLGGWGNTQHGLERGTAAEQRWHLIDTPQPGKIETGRWYRIRVRCEGRHYEAWLDDLQVLDFTDDAKAILRGKVGVGTWATQVKFRHIRVTSLEGRTLYEGTPNLSPGPSTANFWSPYSRDTDKADVSLSSEQPLNSTRCQEIRSTSGETGVKQDHFCIRSGERYTGSVWARGEAPEGLVVRLRSGRTVLDEKKLSKPSTEWKSYAYIFKPEMASEDATLEVGVVGKGHVWLDQVSLMSEAARKTGGFRPDLLRAVRELHPPIIRWPGGSFIDFYQWKDGIGPQEKRGSYPRAIWDDQDVNAMGTDEFLRLCRTLGTEPLIVVNVGQFEANQRKAYIQEAAEWVEYCNGSEATKWGKIRAHNGHPKPYGVRYWEIGNETWGMGADSYAELVREFVPAMKAVDPSIKILVCGSSGYGSDRNGLPWNRTLLEQDAHLFEYLSIHHYENPDRFEQGPRDYERFFRQNADLIAHSRNPKVKLFVSEWNAQSTDWRTGLYAGGLLNAFERSGDVVEIASPALFLRHVSATAWDNALINFDSCRWFPAPNYVVMKLWWGHYAPEVLELQGDAGPLNAIATRSTDGKTLHFKAVNPTDQAVDVELRIQPGYSITNSELQLVQPGTLSAKNTLDAPNTIHPVSALIQQDGQTLRFTLPAFSAGIVTTSRG